MVNVYPAQGIETRLVPEASYGVTPPTPVYKRLNGFGVVLGATVEIETFAPPGALVPTIPMVNDDYSEGEVSGRVDFNGLAYVLSGLFGPATITSLAGTPAATSWEWVWNGRTPNVPVTYSLMSGFADSADIATGFLFNTMEISGGREDGFEISGDGLARALTAGNTFPVEAPVDVPAVPAGAVFGNVYLDPTWAGLGVTQLLYCYEMELAIGERMGRIRPINKSKSSDAVVDVADQEHELTLTLGRNAVADAQLAKLRAGTRVFPRVEWEGDVISGANKYLFQVDTCLIYSEVGMPDNVQDASTREFTGRIAIDPVSGNAIRCKLINTLTAL